MRTMTTNNIIWQTNDDPEKIGEYEIARNIEVRNHKSGGIEMRVTQQTLRTDAVSLPKVLDLSEVMDLVGVLMDAVLERVKKAEKGR